MLHVQRRRAPVASWSARGWPTLLTWHSHPDVPLLYWALHEVSAAVAAEDRDAVEDLLTEAEVLLERLWTGPPAVTGQRQFVAVGTSLWSEIQRGRGVEELTQIALHARLLCRAVAPASGHAATRPADAVPPYRSPGERIRGGRLPLIQQVPRDPVSRPAHEQFLILLATVLSNGGGHLSDYQRHRRPLGTDPRRTGWPDGTPTGTMLGSIRSGGDDRDDDLLLRPGPCVTAVRRRATAGTVASANWTVDEVGWALARSWLTDTTLLVDATRVRRIHTAALIGVVDHRREQLWRLPLGVFHPDQFGPRGPRRGTSAPNPRLRVLRPAPREQGG